MPSAIHNDAIPPEMKVWRYMRIDKFEWLLNHRALYFCRGDRFSDTFEGSRPKFYAEGNYQALFESIYADNPDNDPDELKKFVFERAGVMFRKIREYFFINCWHLSNSESDAMWRLYGDEDKTIAIQTTYSRFCTCLPKECLIKRVAYIDDFNSDGEIPDKANHIFLNKRREFAHELELRAIVQKPIVWDDSEVQSNPMDHIPISIDLEAFIENVYIGPMASPSAFDEVTALLKKYKLSIIPQKSSLSDEPVYW